MSSVNNKLGAIIFWPFPSDGAAKFEKVRQTVTKLEKLSQRLFFSKDRNISLEFSKK